MAERMFFLLIFIFSGPAISQEQWPAKPVRWIVPYAAGGTPEAFRDLIRSEIPKWAEVVKAAKIQSE